MQTNLVRARYRVKKQSISGLMVVVLKKSSFISRGDAPSNLLLDLEGGDPHKIEFEIAGGGGQNGVRPHGCNKNSSSR